MILSSRPIFVGAVLGVVMAAGAAFAAESDNGPRLDGIGQGIRNIGQNIGRRLDVTQLFGHRDPEEDAGGREASAASVRIDRLENQIRALNGLVEELQHSMRRLEDQLRRSQESAAGLPPSAASPQPPRAAATPEPPLPGPVAISPVGPRRGDAFDPNLNPSAPGAPRPIGATPPSAPLPVGTATGAPAADLRSPGAPLDLTHGRLGETPPPAEAAPAPGPSAALSPIATAPQTPKDEFDLAVSKLRQGEYEAAEIGFAGFLTRNPKSRLAPQAVFNLGESFFLRKRYREAAEKYLEITAKHPSAPQGPEAMLRLGQSLHEIGANEQACASFGEIAVKYPGAPARVKEIAQQESKKVRC
ncbi:tol-pal system protein YbgF [Methylosinus sp. H3A]|uniref:tol-pal system protein YbgF n=1 Tax=Methylosinus sp. H3A TaxID=2785786 RepID=UPI0018C22F80|nr:tol-pal system protein YbgF [Methylosinus sp. H3A]MBG0811269.1 tol-pal system protein YbgF [Methylosinus sp. H3A]